MARSALVWILLGAVLPLSGCSTYRSNYRYQPRPLEAQVVLEDDEIGARALLSVVGIRRKSRSAGRPAEVEIRIRIENRTEGTVLFEEDSLLLLSADLKELGGHRFQGPAPGAISAGAAASYTLFFPLPEVRGEEGPDLDGFNLRWTLRFPERNERITVGSTFERVAYGDDDAYYPVYPYHFGFGYRSFYCY